VNIETSNPQIVLISAPDYPERVQTLIEALLDRKIRVRHISSLLSGTDWNFAAQVSMDAIKGASAACLLINEPALAAADLEKTVSLVERLRTPIVHIRLDPIELRNAPSGLGEKKWIDYIEPKHLKQVIDNIMRAMGAHAPRSSAPVMESPSYEQDIPSQPAQAATKSPGPPPQDIPNAPPPPAPESAVWTSADNDLKQAFHRAVSLSDGGVVTVRALFATILETSSDDFAALILPFTKIERGDDVPARIEIRRKLRLSQSPEIPITGFPRHNEAVELVLSNAMAMKEHPDDPLTCEFVFLALFKPRGAGESGPIDPVFEDLGADPDRFLESLRGEYERRGRRGATIVGDILDLRKPYLAWDRPHVDNDRVEGAIPPDRDLLDARKPALRFAKLLAARDVPPPIALGLFGNWGSGKTFFMGLMRDRIADLSKNGGEGYVRRVVQIDFNAWHYHDTNLWASLAMRIFEGLAKELAGNEPSDVEKKRKELHQKIRSSASRRSEALEQRDEALTRRSAAAKELEDLRMKRDDFRNRSVTLQLQAAWHAVSRGAEFGRLQSAATALQRNFGIDAAIDSAGQIRKLATDIGDTRNHAFGVLSAVGQRFRGLKAGAFTVALLALVVLGAISLGWGLEWFDAIAQLNLPRFSATIVQFSTIVSVIAAWCGCRVRELGAAIDTIGAVEAQLAAAEKKLQPDDAIRQIEAQIAELDKNIHKKTEELSAAEREIAEATAEIERINRGGLVYDFLMERTAASSYLGQLGLISTIRQDIERLDVLLKDFVALGQNPIGRIVLYIDDLDRCHPDKVVEVLQAVHLLVAFDLFNVVVGVDARWLERSLYRQYVGEAKDGVPLPDDPFSPQDYLEKIFQIPYALAPIDKTSFRNLIGGMVETRSDYRQKERERARKADEEAAKAAQRQREQANVESVSTEGAEGSKDSVVAREESKPDESLTGKEESSSKAPARPSEAALFFEDHEEEFIANLYAFIDRPRLAKRFINIYRLLRVRADDEGESRTFAVSADSNDFRAALLLLAIHVGHPNVAARLTQAIEFAKDSRSAFINMLSELASGANTTIALSEKEREEIGVIIDKVQAIGSKAPADLAPYVRWAPRVGCFSFEWHRVPVRRAAAAGVQA
jgi:septal ring factor EnvC (AmiA/AmiB activator)